LRDYCTGLVMPCERKSVEPMAAITAPERTAAQHQSLLHFVGQGGWSDAAVLGKVREMVLPGIERYGPIEAWIIDDTSFPKQGRHSVGVAHQYCGQLGKQANCQTAVSLSLANHDASLPVAYRLYLTKAWAEDDVRRRKAGNPGRAISGWRWGGLIMVCGGKVGGTLTERERSRDDQIAMGGSRRFTRLTKTSSKPGSWSSGCSLMNAITLR
jgi:SRSO17 transposase